LGIPARRGVPHKLHLELVQFVAHLLNAMLDVSNTSSRLVDSFIKVGGHWSLLLHGKKMRVLNAGGKKNASVPEKF
jgi:hypothetical protein